MSAIVTAADLPTDRDTALIDVLKTLGGWASDEAKLAELRASFASASPFPHVVIRDFFAPRVADGVESQFPRPTGTRPKEWQSQGWHVYDNPIEGKLAMDDVERMAQRDPVFPEVWSALQSPGMLALMQDLTGIPELENDPHLHGAGLHYHPPGSRLEMHLDYSIHPVSGKERRVNLIVYMNRGWEEAWGGHLVLWEGTHEALSAEAARVAPTFNTAVLFRTSDVSWHGMPDPVECPEGEARKSVAIYYVGPQAPDPLLQGSAERGPEVSDPRAEATKRFKASYQPRPGELGPQEEAYKSLCRMRVERRLTPEDVAQHCPGFTQRWKD